MRGPVISLTNTWPRALGEMGETIFNLCWTATISGRPFSSLRHHGAGQLHLAPAIHFHARTIFSHTIFTSAENPKWKTINASSHEEGKSGRGQRQWHLRLRTLFANFLSRRDRGGLSTSQMPLARTSARASCHFLLPGNFPAICLICRLLEFVFCISNKHKLSIWSRLFWARGGGYTDLWNADIYLCP